VENVLNFDAMASAKRREALAQRRPSRSAGVHAKLTDWLGEVTAMPAAPVESEKTRFAVQLTL